MLSCSLLEVTYFSTWKCCQPKEQEININFFFLCLIPLPPFFFLTLLTYNDTRLSVYIATVTRSVFLYWTTYERKDIFLLKISLFQYVIISEIYVICHVNNIPMYKSVYVLMCIFIDLRHSLFHSINILCVLQPKCFNKTCKKYNFQIMIFYKS